MIPGLNLTKNAKLMRVSNAVPAGTTVVNCTAVDMQGFESVTFLCFWGAITATGVQSIQADQSLDGSTNWNGLLASKVTAADTDDNKVSVLEVVRPTKRYVRCTVNRATATSVIDAVIAILVAPKAAPTTHDASTVVSNGKVVVSPAEGTP